MFITPKDAAQLAIGIAIGGSLFLAISGMQIFALFAGIIPTGDSSKKAHPFEHLE